MSRDLRVTVPVSRHPDFMALVDRTRGWRSCSWVETVEREMTFLFKDARVDFEAALRLALFRVEAFDGPGVAEEVHPVGGVHNAGAEGAALSGGPGDDPAGGDDHVGGPP